MTEDNMREIEQHIDRQLSKMLTEIRSKYEKSASDKVWDVLTKLTVAAVIALTGWGLKLSIDVANLQLISMTTADGYALEQRLMGSLAPPWLREDLSEIKALVKDLEQRMRAIEKQGR